MSELHVAKIGRVGCGAVCHVRSTDGGVRSDRWERLLADVIVIVVVAVAIALSLRVL